ncbi:hypothetical protein ONE63_007989 [Megalurothrips usitatus]|uniref:Uncharacterized protein n=1 Tax=Megalurothrips usitatus TaxID=439358 RepID=A0AAV7XSR4_9NEOP|nr:hypothetical protein ONE63_007989 [Megalurothrips usitatus]
MVTWPLATGRLTFAVPSAADSGWAWFAPQYVLQSTAISCSFFCFAGLQVVHVTLALVAAALLRTLAQLVSAARGRRQLRRAVQDHQALLAVVARFCAVFEEPLFHIHAGALGFALLATTLVVKGQRDLYVLGLWPIAFAYTTVLGLEGDLVQESSELMLDAAYSGRWQSLRGRQDGGLPFAKDVLLVMRRASRPATIRALWLGPLSLPTLHRLLSSWYSFTQLFLRLQK